MCKLGPSHHDHDDKEYVDDINSNGDDGYDRIYYFLQRNEKCSEFSEMARNFNGFIPIVV